MSKHRIAVYIPDEKEYGYVVSLGSYVSIVHYVSGGIMYEVLMLNDDLDFLEEVETEEEE